MAKNRPNKIIIIDDEELVTNYYIQALKFEGYDVEYFDSVDEFSPLLLEKGRLSIDLFIVDIMMPPGSKYRDEPTSDGIYTGLFLARDIRKKDKKVPIILFSNFTISSVRQSANQVEGSINNCIVLQKHDYRPKDLVNLIKEDYIPNGEIDISSDINAHSEEISPPKVSTKKQSYLINIRKYLGIILGMVCVIIFGVMATVLQVPIASFVQQQFQFILNLHLWIIIAIFIVIGLISWFLSLVIKEYLKRMINKQ